MQALMIHPTVLDEDKWYSTTNARLLFSLLQPNWTWRKILLGLCASCRHVVESGRDREGVLSKGIQLAELAVENKNPGMPWSSEFAEELIQIRQTGGVRSKSVDMIWHLLAVASAPESIKLTEAVFCFEESRRSHRDDSTRSDILRDIFGNPFRPLAFDPRWRTSDVVGLARAIYDDKTFERMPILADALMDAGCEDEQVIAHCRGPGPHVRGCWVVDLVLEKE